MTTYQKLVEILANVEHERWSKWQEYLHSKLRYSEYEENGKTVACYIMDAGDYEHWQRQIDTPYSELSENEKDSDRKEAIETIEAIQKYDPDLLEVS